TRSLWRSKYQDRGASLKGLAWQVHRDDLWSVPERIRVCNLLQSLGLVGKEPDLVRDLLQDKDADVRAEAVWLLGLNDVPDRGELLLKALTDGDAFVRRRACEALIGAGIEPPVEALRPLLADRDQFLATAARLVLQRIDPERWAGRLVKDADDRVA